MSILRVGIAGLGTVGTGVIQILQEKALLLGQRCGKKLVVSAVSARNKAKERPVPLEGIAWYDDPLDLATDPGIDVVVEVIGGESGVAYNLCEKALLQGKHVVTANKAMIAHHGVYFAELAEKKGRSFMFEAAVAGGIPVIKVLREGLAANSISSVAGIMNGTCNYILTTMQETGRAFTDVLHDAQRLGYAEADPSFDIDGVDTAHKLAILSSIAFGAPVDVDALHVEGIRNLSYEDIHYAEGFGYRIKLLGIGRKTAEGVSLYVYPAMVPSGYPIAQVKGVTNAIVLKGDRVGSIILEGPGAGSGPTASAVVADIMDIAAGRKVPVFNQPVSSLKEQPCVPIDKREGVYYIRIGVDDKLGVMASITNIFSHCNISLDAVVQKPVTEGEIVNIVVLTHHTKEALIAEAISHITQLEAVRAAPHRVRVEIGI